MSATALRTYYPRFSRLKNHVWTTDLPVGKAKLKSSKPKIISRVKSLLIHRNHQPLSRHRSIIEQKKKSITNSFFQDWSYRSPSMSHQQLPLFNHSCPFFNQIISSLIHHFYSSQFKITVFQLSFQTYYTNDTSDYMFFFFLFSLIQSNL